MAERCFLLSLKLQQEGETISKRGPTQLCLIGCQLSYTSLLHTLFLTAVNPSDLQRVITVPPRQEDPGLAVGMPGDLPPALCSNVELVFGVGACCLFFCRGPTASENVDEVGGDTVTRRIGYSSVLVLSAWCAYASQSCSNGLSPSRLFFTGAALLAAMTFTFALCWWRVLLTRHAQQPSGSPHRHTCLEADLILLDVRRCNRSGCVGKL
jgi:hypothetical protein